MQVSELATAEDLNKLTVPQLKAICKERKITGYSKLSKNAIVQKILDLGNNPSSKHALPPEVSLPPPIQKATPPQGSDGAPVETAINENVNSFPPQLALPSPSTPTVRIHSGPPPESPSLPSASFNTSQPSEASVNAPSSTQLTKPSQKRILKLPQLTNVPPKKARYSALPGTSHSSGKSVTTVSTSSTLATIDIPGTGSSDRFIGKKALGILEITSVQSNKNKSLTLPGTQLNLTKKSIVPTIIESPFKIPALIINSHEASAAFGEPRNTVPPNSVLKNGPLPKRFVPLVVRKVNTVTNPVRASQHTTSAPAVLPMGDEQLRPPTLYHLDFPVIASIALTSVSLPPSLSQRKRVPKLAIILTLVSTEDLTNCAQASRLFRYAGVQSALIINALIYIVAYISAVHRLSWSFPGRRLAALFKQYPPTMTNMWPYLRQREQEATARKQTFRDSFLGRALKAKGISEHLWTSPDNPKQAVVAVRFAYLLSKIVVDIHTVVL